MLSVLYFVVLVVLFIALIIMTVTLVVSKKKNNDENFKDEAGDFEDEEYDDEIHDFDETDSESEYKDLSNEPSYDLDEDSAFVDSSLQDSAFSDSAFVDDELQDSAFSDSAFYDGAIGDSAFAPAVDAVIEDDGEALEEEKISSPMDTTQKLPQQEVRETIKKQRQESKALSDELLEDEEVPEQIEVAVEEEVPEQMKMAVEEEVPEQEQMEMPVEETVPEQEQMEIPVEEEVPEQMEMPVMQPVAPMKPITPMQPIAPMQTVEQEQISNSMQLQEEEIQEASVDGGMSEAYDDTSFDDLFGDSAFADSAFVESKIPVLSDEAIQASVKEAEAMGAAVTGMTGSLVKVNAAVAEHEKENEKATNKKLGRMGKQANNKNLSYAKPTDDFFWFNMIDASERPSYKTLDMYYHHFNLAEDCIEDLLIEMYDSGLVRTEEIRYIAYGIQPRAVSIKEILTSGNSNYVQQEKLKEPTTQDLVNIYEKWCGYVDKLFDIIEIHADEMTYNKIRHILYEYGRSDVDELIEGK